MIAIFYLQYQMTEQSIMKHYLIKLETDQKCFSCSLKTEFSGKGRDQYLSLVFYMSLVSVFSPLYKAYDGVLLLTSAGAEGAYHFVGKGLIFRKKREVKFGLQ